MFLKEIASIAGLPGLYKIFKSTSRSLIVETLDAKKQKMSIDSSHRVSVLQEVSIYTNDKEGSVLLANVLHAIHEKYNGVLPVKPKSENKELLAFLKSVLDNYDVVRVYASDVKKLVSWYNILLENAPEVLVPQVEEEPKTEETETKEEETT
jgi:hypothetical protein